MSDGSDASSVDRASLERDRVALDTASAPVGDAGTEVDRG
jgi:hypothetical protein